MLQSLYIRDFVLIKNLSLDFESGFTVFTGETGAGKSILLDALNLALGGKGDVIFINKDASESVIVAEFNINNFNDNHSIISIIKEQGFEIQETLTLKRILSRANRSRSFINDQPISLQLMKEIGDKILEIHGQFDQLFLPSKQKYLLDQFVNFADKNLLKEAFQTWQNTKEQLQTHQKAQENWRSQKSFYLGQLKDLEEVKPQPQEEQLLLEARESIGNSDRVKEIAQETLTILKKPTNVISQLAQSYKLLEKLPQVFQTPQHLLDQAMISIQEASSILGSCLQAHNDAAAQIEIIDERLQALRSLGRKYMVPPDEIYLLYKKIQTTIAENEDQNNLDILQTKLEIAKKKYMTFALSQRQARINVASQLEQLILQELPDLCLPNVKIKIAVTPIDSEENWLNDGIDKVEFLVSLNPQQELNSLAKVASGGEMARLMLALKVVLVKNGELSTIIFDEIDSNVGGQVALAIGQKLNTLSKQVQVLAITHSPQVASKAGHHFLVNKTIHNNHAETMVELIPPSKRKVEIARMLGGENITPATIATAAELIKINNID